MCVYHPKILVPPDSKFKVSNSYYKFYMFFTMVSISGKNQSKNVINKSIVSCNKIIKKNILKKTSLYLCVEVHEQEFS